MDIQQILFYHQLFDLFVFISPFILLFNFIHLKPKIFLLLQSFLMIFESILRCAIRYNTWKLAPHILLVYTIFISNRNLVNSKALLFLNALIKLISTITESKFGRFFHAWFRWDSFLDMIAKSGVDSSTQTFLFKLFGLDLVINFLLTKVCEAVQA